MKSDPARPKLDERQISVLAAQAAALQQSVLDARQTETSLNDTIAHTRRDIESMSELGETESLRLQMAMDRLSKMMSTLSNILKKISDTSQTITQNLK